MANRRAKGPNDLKRRKEHLPPGKTALIVCEDSKSSPAYFNELCRKEDVFKLVIVKGVGGDPAAVYDRALALFNDNPDYDHVFCVFDRDSHGRYDDICRQISEKFLKIGRQGERKSCGTANFRAITSWPCYEYWLLLHYTEHTAPIVETMGRTNGQQTEHLLRQQPEMSDYAKGNARLYKKVCEKTDDAMTRAQTVWQRSQANNAPNPHTRIHQLVAILRSLKSK